MIFKVALVGHVDHGKSTLIGRLLSDTQQIKLEKTEKVKSFCNSSKKKFEYAFLLDALEEEQTQGITIDRTEVHWKYGELDYLFVDTPGHKEFVKNLISGASDVDAVILILDANEDSADVFYRQMILLKTLGIKQFIIVVNKMDLVDWSENAWAHKKKQVQFVLNKLQVMAPIIPVAAWYGDNLLKSSINMSWYEGPTFVEALNKLDRTHHDNSELRFYIQDVYKFDERRIHVGRVESGSLQVGDELCFYPNLNKSTVTEISVFGEQKTSAKTGDSVGLVLKDPLFLDRGFLAFKATEFPAITNQIEADIFWLNEISLKAGKQFKIKISTLIFDVIVEKIIYDINSHNYIQTEQAPQLNQFGRISLKFFHSQAVDLYKKNPALSRFVILSEGEIQGGGQFVELTTSLNVQTENQNAKVFWMTGYSGAGKSSLAQRFQIKLKQSHISAVILDGDQLRTGLCSDLGFSDQDRFENNRRVAEVAKLLANTGLVVITALISPRKAHRTAAKNIIGISQFVEVFIDCPLNVCEERDVKGLYKLARAGKIDDFTGINSIFEAPQNPDVVVSTAFENIEESVKRIYSYFESNSIKDEVSNEKQF